MPTKNRGQQYNLVQSDDLDTRIPLLPDDAFQHGIQFNCKFIGSMDIPRPTTRVEIVAAMRRVRFEFKQKGIKKKKVTVTVSVNGIKTTLRKRKPKKRRIGRNKDVYVDVDNSILIESHPIYRIFYVSHDSQDVKIFSYIARETASNVFHCCVFKATKKAQAMRIVRTVGQAFEVCHKLVGHPDEVHHEEYPEKKQEEVDFDSVPSSPIKRGGGSLEEKASSAAHKAHKIFSKLARRSNGHEEKIHEKHETTTITQESEGKLTLTDSNKESLTELPPKHRPNDLNLTQKESPEPQADLVNLSTPATPTLKNLPVPPSPVKNKGGNFQFDETWAQNLGNSNSMGAIHEAHLLKEKLEQQQQQTQAAIAQINLLRDQLAAESSARIEAQARTHQLLLHNKELLDHLQSLVRHIHELEGRIHQNPSGSSMNNSPAPALPQLTPRSKIERWFAYAALMSEKEAAKNPVLPVAVEEDEIEAELEDDFLFLEDEGDLVFQATRGKVKVRESKRTLVSKGESGFVSENTLNSHSNPNMRRRGYFNFSSSSIFRRMLKLGPRSDEVPRIGGKKKRRFGRGRRARRAELEAVVMRSGQGIGNKTFVGSTSSVNFKRGGGNNSSQKSKVSSL